MSTKIYNGFALPKLSTKAALNVLGAQRTAIQALVDQKHREVLAERVSNFLDTYVLTRHLDKKLPEKANEYRRDAAWYICLSELDEEQKKCRGGHLREPLIDCDVELTLFMRPTTGLVFGYIQEERLGVESHLLSVEGISEFGYWNNTDRPEDIPAREWNRRARIWNQALDHEDAVKLSMRWQPGYTKVDDVKDLFPSFEERLAKYALGAIQNEELKLHWLPEERDEFHKAVRILRQVELAAKDPESDIFKRVLAISEQYREILLPDLREHLFTRLEELPGLPPLEETPAASAVTKE